ncbi:hypothetical protein [Coxiella burnetii]|uniref:hypothetical protein n=1 Tax=Coxiella burnetii TaxID=777 RepID=UPI000183D0C7|nr:hypothetical protein [Coxiella burnetii]ACJ18370.1 hypothetical cytosolic protein [Coxiella burnetii CbuG_Q212]ATN66744.1 hypothetical protein AYM17_04905 [Coxiella burnetii]OYK86071.1 hypothetical protein CbuQ229_05130 [Coxiella burnetii]
MISTDAKILINDWQNLHDKIVENATYIKESKKVNETASTLISDQQLEDALKGPLQSFFRQKLSAYATLSKIRLLLVTTKDEIFKKNPREDAPPKAILEKITSAELNKIQQTLNELTKSHYQQWQEKRESWNKLLIMALTVNGITLSEIEIKELKDKEPLSELKNRFIDLNIPFPSTKLMNFEHYLRAKVYLATRSSLSRQQQPHDDNIITKFLKKLNNEFNQIHKEETELIKAQQNETQEPLKPLPFEDRSK